MLADVWVNNPWVVGVLAGVLSALIVGVPAFLWKTFTRKMTELLKEVRPNGGRSLSLGDTAKRTEDKVDALIVTVATQKGHTDAVEAEVFNRLGKLETRAEVAKRSGPGAH